MALERLRLAAVADCKVPLPAKVRVLVPRAEALLTVRSAPERKTPVVMLLLASNATLPLEMVSTPLMFRLLLTEREPAPTMESEDAVRVSPPKVTRVPPALVTVTFPAVMPPLATVTVAWLVKLASLPESKVAGVPLVLAQLPEVV